MKIQEVVALISERRSNPEQNPKQDTIDELRSLQAAHRGQRLFVTFTQVQKLGINPGSNHGTPLGIYSYPIQYVIERNLEVPYAGEQPYIQVFRPASGANVVQLGKLTWDQAYTLVDAIPSAINAEPLDRDDDDDSDEYDRPDKSSPGAYLWAWVHNYAAGIASGLNGIKVATRRIFKAIGIDALWDDQGQGIIHPNEPLQAVFFDTGAVEPVTQLVNRSEAARTRDQVVAAGKTPDQASLEDLVTWAVQKRRPSPVFERRWVSELANHSIPQLYQWWNVYYGVVKNANMFKHIVDHPNFTTDDRVPNILADYCAIVKRPWPSVERLIAQTPFSAFTYATEVLDSRFKLGEPSIKTAPRLWDRYQQQFDIAD